MRWNCGLHPHIDLTARVPASPGATKDSLIRQIQESAAVDVGDFFVYTIGDPIADLDAAPYGGSRLPIEARIETRPFVKFHMDVGIGDVLMEPLEVIKGRDWLQFAGILNGSIYMIPREQQFAEKLHAYTLPRVSVNSRVRDLIDMVLLIASDTLDKDQTVKALSMTFTRRKTHDLPVVLSGPPVDWEGPFQALAQECALRVGMNEAFLSVQEFC